MAVPVRTKSKGSSLPRTRHDGFRLEYAGKKSATDILLTVPGQYESVPPYIAGDNRLYWADNLGVLASLLREKEVSGQVRLVYIDPPFATAAAFESRQFNHAYDDYLVGPNFVETLRERLILIYHLLAENGSLYLHLDERMVFHFRIVLDEIFGANCFRNIITRRKSNPKNYTRKKYGNISDYILFYTKSDTYVWNRPVEVWDEDRAIKEYQYLDDQGRRYKKVPIHAPGTRNGETGQAWRGKFPPPGKHWQYRPRTLDEMDARGEIYWSPTGNPRRKVFLDASSGVPVQDIWSDMRDALNQNVYITGYPTEKNPALLRRIIEASSDVGDLVLDCYSGSGTTLFESSNLDRRWIGVDHSDEAISTTLRRFDSGSHRMGDFVNTKAQLPMKLSNVIDDFTFYQEVH